MARMTVLAVAVMCDGRLFPEDTPIDEIPPGNRESVRMRYSKEIDVSPVSKSPPRPPVKAPKAPPAAEKVDPPSADKVDPQAQAEGAGQESSPEASTADESTNTPLPAMAEELVVLLKAGGIETVEAATEYFTRNKSFRPLKGVGEAKDEEIRKALGL